MSAAEEIHIIFGGMILNIYSKVLTLSSWVVLLALDGRP